jgi:hypothetical protein
LSNTGNSEKIQRITTDSIEPLVPAELILKIDLFDFVDECHLVWEEIKVMIRKAETPIFSRHFPIEFVSNLIEQHGEFQVLSGEIKKKKIDPRF